MQGLSEEEVFIRGGVAQQVKVLAAQTGELSSGSVTHMMEGEIQLQDIVL